MYGFYELLYETATAMDILDKPQCWFNLDETSFCRDPGNTKVAGAKGSPATRRTGGNGRENTTVLACISANGEKLPPLIVFSAKNTWTSWIPVDGAYPGASYSSTNKGWMTSDLFMNWFEFQFLPHVKGKALLILDGHGTHALAKLAKLSLALAKLANENNVTILKLPPHASHMLQPLDKVVFKGMKVSYDQNLSKWQREHPGNILSKKDFVCLLSKVWDTYLTPSLIEKSFKATGIFDLSVPMRVNPSVIDQTKFEPTKLRRYAQMKKEQEENSGTSKVTTTVNTELEKITFSVTFSPRKLLGNQSKTFEEILLDSIKRPDLPSVSGIEKRKKIAREAEVITSKEHLEVLKREENLKAKGKGKKKSSDGKGIKSKKKFS